MAAPLPFELDDPAVAELPPVPEPPPPPPDPNAPPAPPAAPAPDPRVAELEDRLKKLEPFQPLAEAAAADPTVLHDLQATLINRQRGAPAPPATPVPAAGLSAEESARARAAIDKAFGEDPVGTMIALVQQGVRGAMENSPTAQKAQDLAVQNMVGSLRAELFGHPHAKIGLPWVDQALSRITPDQLRQFDAAGLRSMVYTAFHAGVGQYFGEQARTEAARTPATPLPPEAPPAYGGPPAPADPKKPLRAPRWMIEQAQRMAPDDVAFQRELVQDMLDANARAS